jgi:hypothetical protein
MEFYFCNENGSAGVFEENDTAKAIAAAKRIEADLYTLKSKPPVLIFAAKEDDEYNSELLKEHGVYIENNEIKCMRTNEVRSFSKAELIKIILTGRS